MDFADFSDDPDIDLLLHPLELGQIFLLMADHGLDAVLVAEAGHFPGLLQGFGHGLFQGNSLHAVFDPQLNQVQAHVRVGDKYKHLRAHGL